MGLEMKSGERIKRLAEFHGHLGPYLIIGMKMGDLSNELLGTESGAGTGQSHKKAIVKTGKKPPISCIVDGIQFSSGCTLGKGNIEVLDQESPEATFIMGEKQITIKLKTKIKTKNGDLEAIALKINEKSPQELFEITKNF